MATKNTRFLALCCLLSLVACDSQISNPSNFTQSATEVRDRTQALKLQPLSKPKNTEPLTASKAYKRQLSDVFIEGKGRVVRQLSDDNNGSRHQRFILRVKGGNTILVAHNIDLAPRINSLSIGDTISFRGEYVYNEKGGILHWTHHDPSNQITGGWLKHHNKTYE